MSTAAAAAPPGRRPDRGAGRMVVLRALGLGDLCTAVPALRALRRAYPDHRLQLAAPHWLAPVVALIDAVDEHLDVAPLAPLPAVAHHAELAVNLHGQGPQSTRLLQRSGPARLVAFAHPDLPATVALPRWREGEHEVHRWCRLLVESGIDADPTDLHLPAPDDGDGDGDGDGGTAAPVILHLGAAAAARCWPPERWAQLAAALREDGRPVLLTGGAAQAADAATVAATAGLAPSAAVAGRTSLVELVGLVARARLVVCGDTGVAHLASAFGVASVVLFGPVPPSEWGPPPGPHTALWAGRRGDPHGDRPDEGLLALSVPTVRHAVVDRLAGDGRGRVTASIDAGGPRGSEPAPAGTGADR